jgi:hypothetical protein
MVAPCCEARSHVPDEWLHKDNAEGVVAQGDVMFEPVTTARSRVTRSVELDLQPGTDDIGEQVEDAAAREQRHLARFRDLAEERAQQGEM